MKRQVLLFTCLTTLLTSVTHANQEQLARSLREAKAETVRTSEQLKSTLGAVNGLTTQKEGDLRPAYDVFCSEVTKTQSAADLTKKRVQWMQSDGSEYFKDWQRSIDGITNESLKKKAQKRLNVVQQSFNKVEESLKAASEKFAPFLSDLGDIQKALSTDITAGGVKAIRGTVKTANWDHQFVNQSVNSALKGMEKMEKSLSTEAK